MGPLKAFMKQTQANSSPPIEADAFKGAQISPVEVEETQLDATQSNIFENTDLSDTDLSDRAQFEKKTISSEEILLGEKEVFIQHGQHLYRLTHTKQGKLILTK